MPTLTLESTVYTLQQLLDVPEAQVALAGRSNVGKSSLMNKLFGRKALVKVSSRPGKTANINFFEADGVHFVDLPGYGFARVSAAEKQRWADLIGGYFQADRSHNLVVVLVDIRLDAQKLDVQMINYLSAAELPFIVALTKCDKLSRPKQQQAKAKLAKQFGLDPMAMIVTSAEKGDGIQDLKRFIQNAVE